MTHETEDPRDVLRALWAAESNNAVGLDEDCSPTKTCRNMQDVTFDGFAEPGSDLRVAWRQKLAREGKLNTSGQSISNLVLRPTESH